MQVTGLAHEGLVEQAEVTAVLKDGLDGSKPVQVHELNSTQQQADSLLQPVRLLLQAAIDGQLLKQLKPHEKARSGKAQRRQRHTTGGQATVLWSTADGRPWFPA